MRASRGVKRSSLSGPGHLGLVELHAADAEHRQQRDGEHDDADTAEPLDLLAIEQDRRRHRVEPHEHRRAGGRVARTPIRRTRRRSSRRATSMNGTVPSKLIAVHISATIKKPSRLRISCESCLNGSQSTKPTTQRDRERDREVPDLAVVVEERDADRRQQRRAEQQEQHARACE